MFFSVASQVNVLILYVSLQHPVITSQQNTPIKDELLEEYDGFLAD